MTWAMGQARERTTVISGFHSPLEQSVLKVLMTAGTPCVIVIARDLAHASVPSEWIDAARNGKIAIVSMNDNSRRLTGDVAARRNHWIVEHAERVVIAHASPGGGLVGQALQWQQHNRDIEFLG